MRLPFRFATFSFQVDLYICIYNFSFAAESKFFPKLQTLWHNVDLFHTISKFTLASSSSAEL